MPIPWTPTRPGEDQYEDIYRAVTGKGRYHIETGTTWMKPFPIRTFEERVEDARWRLVRGLIVLLIVAVLVLAFWRRKR